MVHLPCCHIPPNMAFACTVRPLLVSIKKEERKKSYEIVYNT